MIQQRSYGFLGQCLGNKILCVCQGATDEPSLNETNLKKKIKKIWRQVETLHDLCHCIDWRMYVDFNDKAIISTS